MSIFRPIFYFLFFLFFLFLTGCNSQNQREEGIKQMDSSNVLQKDTSSPVRDIDTSNSKSFDSGLANALSHPIPIKKQLESPVSMAPKPDYRTKERSVEESSGFRSRKGHGGADGGDAMGPGSEYVGSDYVDNDRILKPKYQPKYIGKKEFVDEESNDTIPKKVYLIATVNCDGIITKLKLDLDHIPDRQNLRLIKNKLIGQRCYTNTYYVLVQNVHNYFFLLIGLKHNRIYLQ